MSTTLFTNARLVLDDADRLTDPCQVAVDADRISYVGGDTPALESDLVIDLGGRTLMPGLIDAHAHVTGLSLSPKNLASPAADLVLASAGYLRNCLMAG